MLSWLCSNAAKNHTNIIITVVLNVQREAVKRIKIMMFTFEVRLLNVRYVLSDWLVI